MKLCRRRLLRLGAGAAALPLVPSLARAQAYPTRPITMIVPIAAGSSADVVGRLVAERMGTEVDSRRPFFLRTGGSNPPCDSQRSLNPSTSAIE